MRFASLLILLALSLTPLFAQQSSGPTPPPNPCLQPEQKQLDFWVGDWDLTWPAQKDGQLAHGTNSIHRVLDSCVVEENFSAGSSGHLRGKSMSIFDIHSGQWRQTWVDNEGGYLDFTGTWKDSQMTLSREFNQNGKLVQQRMVFKNIAPNEFDWSWESSNDSGKTWQVSWPIHYKRKTS
jgi:hypothetical protein